eukprot:6462575-Amphidinium_carterae.1
MNMRGPRERKERGSRLSSGWALFVQFFYTAVKDATETLSPYGLGGNYSCDGNDYNCKHKKIGN